MRGESVVSDIAILVRQCVDEKAEQSVKALLRFQRRQVLVANDQVRAIPLTDGDVWRRIRGDLEHALTQFIFVVHAKCGRCLVRSR